MIMKKSFFLPAKPNNSYGSKNPNNPIKSNKPNNPNKPDKSNNLMNLIVIKNLKTHNHNKSNT